MIKKSFKATVSSYFPQSLGSIFSIEGIDRYMAGSLQASLFIILLNYMPFSHAKAIEIFTAFLSLSYISPLLGGWIADRFLGSQKTLLIGTIITTLGFLMLNRFIEHWFMIGLSFTVVGTGLIKPNLAVLAGKNYVKKDARKDINYLVFYGFINLGNFLAILSSPLIGELIKWEYAFILPTILSFCNVFLVWKMQKHFGYYGSLPSSPQMAKGLEHINHLRLFMYGVLGTIVFLVVFLLYNTDWVGVLVPSVFTLGALFLVYSILELPKKEQHSSLFLCGLMAIAFIFFMLLNLSFNSFSLFTKMYVDRELTSMWGGQVTDSMQKLIMLPQKAPMTFFMGFSPVWILLILPFYLFIRKIFLERNTPYFIPVSLALGFLSLAVGFGILALTRKFITLDMAVSGKWVFVAYGCLALAEILIIPQVFSLLSRFAPSQILAFLMSFFMLCIALSHWLGGVILDKLLKVVGSVCMPGQVSMGIYCDHFTVYSWIAFGVTFLLFMITPFFKRFFIYIFQ